MFPSQILLVLAGHCAPMRTYILSVDSSSPSQSRHAQGVGKFFNHVDWKSWFSSLGLSLAFWVQPHSPQENKNPFSYCPKAVESLEISLMQAIEIDSGNLRRKGMPCWENGLLTELGRGWESRVPRRRQSSWLWFPFWRSDLEGLPGHQCPPKSGAGQAQCHQNILRGASLLNHGSLFLPPLWLSSSESLKE